MKIPYPKVKISTYIYILSLVVLALSITIMFINEPFDVHGHYHELYDGYIYCNHSIYKPDSTNKHFQRSRIPSLEKYCETDNYILTVEGRAHCYILNKVTDSVEGPMTRSDFEKKCKEYNVKFIEEQGYVGTSSYTKDELPATAYIVLVILSLAMAVPIFRYGDKIERLVCGDIIQSATIISSGINIFGGISMCIHPLIIIIILFMLIVFLLVLIIYILYKRRFHDIGRIIQVVFCTIVGMVITACVFFFGFLLMLLYASISG